MPRFTIYLVKDGYNFNERYSIQNGSVIENNKSVFNNGVSTIHDHLLLRFLSDRKMDFRQIHKSRSTHNVYYRNSDNPNPWWKDFWQIPEPNLENKSTDLIILKEINGKKVIIAHGHGRFLINPLAIEYDFGLKTALNLLDEEKIKSADLFTPSEIALRTRKQSGKKTKFDEYEINIYNSLLKNIAGKVKAEFEDYFKNIDGADSIKFSYSGDSTELLIIVKMLIEKYQLDDYKRKGFDWVDNFRIIKDKGLISNLDELLVDEINNKNQNILLSFPETLDKNAPIYYRYSSITPRSSDASRYPELDIVDQYYQKIQNLTLTVDDIKRQQIIAVDINSNRDRFAQKVYQCLYFDINHNNSHYFIESGVWYKVNDDFITDVDAKYQRIINRSRVISYSYNISAVGLKAKQQNKNKEFVYNSDLTVFLRNSLDANLLDTKLIKKTEICDVLFKENRKIILLHNKFKYGSSALSHLFSQGLVSGERLNDKNFRIEANTIISNTVLHFSTSDRFDKSNYIIAYGVITKKDRSGSFSIPLFSKINLNMFYERLDMIGYEVELIFFEAI